MQSANSGARNRVSQEFAFVDECKRLHPAGRAVHTVSLPAVEGDIEYNIRATTVDGTKLIWPATAPAVNQTVVAMP